MHSIAKQLPCRVSLTRTEIYRCNYNVTANRVHETGRHGGREAYLYGPLPRFSQVDQTNRLICFMRFCVLSLQVLCFSFSLVPLLSALIWRSYAKTHTQPSYFLVFFCFLLFAFCRIQRRGEVHSVTGFVVLGLQKVQITYDRYSSCCYCR